MSTTNIDVALEGRVGLINAGAVGSKNPLVQGVDGALLVSCNLKEIALAGRLFSVANQAVVTTTAGLATTWTGLGVANPSGSGKLLVMHEFAWALAIVGSDDGVVGLMRSTDSGFAAAIAARCARLGYAASVALCDDGATITTPVLDRVCGTHGMGATTTQISAGPNVIDLKGGIILAPGQSICTYTTTAVTSGLVFNLVWEEIPL